MASVARSLPPYMGMCCGKHQMCSRAWRGLAQMCVTSLPNVHCPSPPFGVCVMYQPTVTAIVSGVAKITPAFVKTWYLNKLTERLAKLGACGEGGGAWGISTLLACVCVSVRAAGA